MERSEHHHQCPLGITQTLQWMVRCVALASVPLIMFARRLVLLPPFSDPHPFQTFSVWFFPAHAVYSPTLLTSSFPVRTADHCSFKSAELFFKIFGCNDVIK